MIKNRMFPVVADESLVLWAAAPGARQIVRTFYGTSTEPPSNSFYRPRRILVEL